jgi:hypothetical protein
MIKRLFVLFILTLLLQNCATSILSVKGKKESGDKRIYNTSFENAWIYAKKIFRETGVDIEEENKNEGSIFGQTSQKLGSYGSFIGVWIDETGESSVSISVYTKRVLATQLSAGFSASDFHEKFKLYVDTE